MITSSNVLDLSLQANAKYRCVFNYIFDDGREVNLRPASVGSDYQAVCEARAPSVLQSMIKSDAQEAVSLGIKTAYKYASQELVWYEYLDSGYRNPDPVESYDLMNGIAQPLLAMGLTTEQLAVMLGETVEMAQLVIDHWRKLDPVVIEQFRVIKGSL